MPCRTWRERFCFPVGFVHDQPYGGSWEICSSEQSYWTSSSEVREPEYHRESSMKELRVGRGCCGSRCLHNAKRIENFLSFKRNRWQSPPA
ncbi:unnamed protein product [Brassica rapa subsp. trilocularis]